MSDRSISLRDAQALIDEIRFRVQSEQQTRTPELEKLAADYRTLSRECNDRLRECDSLLKRGLLSEALHFAEQEPSLLDLMAQVDFPQRAEWLELIGLYDLPEPQPPLSEVARALNEAYAQSVSLDKLLARHRWLALARAPLGERCKALRLLKAADAGNPFWEDDLRDLERAWFQEAEAAIETAASQKDAAALRGLVADLTSPDLQERPPAALVKSAKQKLALVARHQARRSLAQLDVPLNDALAALDRPRARALRALWLKHLPVAQLLPGDPLANRVAPVLAWLEDGDREAAGRAAHARAEATLSAAIDDPSTSVARLEELARGVSLTGLEPSPVIATQYTHAVAAARLRERRKSGLIIAGSVAAGLLAIAAVVATLQIRDRNDRLSAMATRIDNLVERDGVEDARKLLDEHGDLKTAPVWVSAEKVVVAAEERERKRAAEFAAALNAVRGGVDNPEAALRQLRQSEPRGDSERRDWTALDSELVATLKRHKEETDRRLSELIAEIEAGLASINDLPEDEAGLDRTEQGLKSVEQPLRSAEGLSAKADGNWRNAVQSLRTRAQYHRDRLVKTRRRIELETVLTDSSRIATGQPGVAAKLDAFVNAFRAYSEEFLPGGSGPAGDLESERVLWWGELQLRSKFEEMRESFVPTPDRVAMRLDELELLKTRVGLVPDQPVLEELIRFIQSVGHRSHGQAGPGSDGARVKLARLLDDRLVKESYVVVYQQNIYYLQDKVAFGKFVKDGELEYVVGYLPGQTKKKLITESSGVVNKSYPKSPQMVLADKYRPELKTLDETKWLEMTEKLAKELLDDTEWSAESGVVDPLLRYRMLRGLLVQAGDGHALLGDALRPLLPQLQDPDLDIDAHWMDPNDAAGLKAKLRAQALLKRSTGILAAWKTAEAKERSLLEAARSTLEAAGWMTRGTGTNWRVRTSLDTKRPIDLLVIVPGESNGTATWERIGRLESSGVVPNSDANPTAFREGRLVFTLQKPPSDK